MPHDVFICASQDDGEYAAEIVKNLEGHSIRCWTAPRDLTEGDLSSQLKAALDQSQVVLLLLSKYSVASKAVERELLYAGNKGIAVLPVSIDYSVIPTHFLMLFAGGKYLDAFQVEPTRAHSLMTEAIAEYLRSRTFAACDFLKATDVLSGRAIEPPPPSEEEGDYIFISYKREDLPRIAQHLRNIANWGYRLWYDKGIPGGSEWDAIIEDRVSRCQLLVVFLSQAASESKWVRREIKFADALDKPILVIKLGEIALTGGLSITLSQYQMISEEAKDFSDELKRAMEYIRLL